MSEFLDKMMSSQRERTGKTSFAERELVRASAHEHRCKAVRHAFLQALSRTDHANIIAEVKRSSPSAGAIRKEADAVQTALAYERAGAAAISVLTESEYFGGSLDDLQRVAREVKIPVLRKDFIVDPHQVYEAAALGASAVLLIVAGLNTRELLALRTLVEDELGMDALVEVHSAEELSAAEDIGTRIIGVNNRNLQTLSVSLETSFNLIKLAPKHALMVAESGLKTAEDVKGLKSAGYKAFLIGEALMRSGDSERSLREMTSVAVAP